MCQSQRVLELCAECVSSTFFSAGSPPPHWPLVKVAASRAAQLRPIAAFLVDLFHCPAIPVNQKPRTPGASLQGAWHYRVSAGTGRSAVSIL